MVMAWASLLRNDMAKYRLFLGLTVAFGFCFLGIKYVEYSAKIHHHTLFGKRFAPTEAPDGTEIEQPDGNPGVTTDGKPAPKEPLNTVGGVKAQPVPGAEGAPPAGSAPVVPDDPAADKEEPASAVSGVGVLPAIEAQKAAGAHIKSDAGARPPPNTGMFFTIYFAMTGLHGIHVLAGVIVFIWLLLRAMKGHFGPGYYGPVDFAALYWHLVDLVWIFLFPLLYLIA
jgi:cytochrome c oxidase subunit 3